MQKKNPMKPVAPRKPTVGTKKLMPKISGVNSGTKKPAVKITTTPSRRNPIPPDYDVILPGMGYTKPTKKSPPKKIKKIK